MGFGDGTQVLSASVAGTLLTEPSPPSKTIERIRTERLLIAAARIVSERVSGVKKMHHAACVSLLIVS